MSIKEDAIITDKISKEGDFTCITFRPDLEKFKITQLDEDHISLFTKRAYDMAGCISKKVKVYLNDSLIKLDGFEEYIKLYMDIDENKELPLIKFNCQNWEICISHSDGQFNQVSFVNSICTTNGGSHVNYVADQIS